MRWPDINTAVAVGVFVGWVLRITAPLPARLPDLRQAHNAIVQSGGSENERYTLVNIEADRITTSLNTLRVQIVRWNAICGVR